MEACIATDTHSLDIAAEYKIHALTQAWPEHAAAALVMLLPSVCCDIVLSGWLALYVAGKMHEPQRLCIALAHRW